MITIHKEETSIQSVDWAESLALFATALAASNVSPHTAKAYGGDVLIVLPAPPSPGHHLLQTTARLFATRGHHVLMLTAGHGTLAEDAHG